MRRRGIEKIDTGLGGYLQQNLFASKKVY